MNEQYAASVISGRSEPAATSPDTTERRRTTIRRVGAAVYAVVVVGCLLSASSRQVSWPVLILLLSVASLCWAAALLLPPARLGWRVSALIGFGVLGAALDLVEPRGPGYVGAFMAVAGLGLVLPVRRAIIASLPVLAATGFAEASGSEHPWSALLNVALGLGFMLAAATSAAASRDAQARAQLLLDQQRSIAEGLGREAVLNERTSLARELHDVLAHTLSGLSLHLEAARMLAERTNADARVREQIAVASRYARSGITEGKRAIAALRGEPIAGVEDCARLVEQFRNDSGILARLEVSGVADTLPTQVSLAVYRVVQESLSNVRRHAADSESVSVELVWTARSVEVLVRNRAPSVPREPPLHPTEPSFGLAGLAERAAALGGDFSAAPTEDGFLVRACLPRTHDAELAHAG